MSSKADQKDDGDKTKDPPTFKAKGVRHPEYWQCCEYIAPSREDKKWTAADSNHVYCQVCKVSFSYNSAKNSKSVKRHMDKLHSDLLISYREKHNNKRKAEPLASKTAVAQHPTKPKISTTLDQPPQKTKRRGKITDFFPEVSKVEYKGPSAGPLEFRHYNPDEVILGKPMKEWLRFSVCFWHTFVGGGGQDPFGSPTLKRESWEENLEGMELAKRRVDVAFEFFQKLGVEYYCFHDFDVAPEGESLEESFQNVDEITDYLLQKQKETGVNLLWATQNLFSHPRYMNGGMTNPDVHVFCYAAAQVQKVMDITHKLGGKNHVFWGGREGYQSLLNTDMKQECDHMSALYKMAIAYKQKKGYKSQFLLGPKPREPTKHQYDYDAQTTMAFLHQYGLQDHFKLNIEPNHTTLAGHEAVHDIYVASIYGKLGSIDSNTGDPLLGWDTDNFPMDVAQTTAIMSVVLEQGGLGTGGLNFDCKVRRESVDPQDLFIAHIGAMDTYALGLRKAAKMKEEGILKSMLEKRYMSWKTEDIAKKIEKGKATLEECAAYAKEKGEPARTSGQQELYECIRNRYIHG